MRGHKFLFILFIVMLGVSEARARSFIDLMNQTFLVPKISGPNCLNAALVSAGLIKHHRYSANSEMLAYLNSPYCQPISANEKKFGDIGIVKNPSPFDKSSHIISHAFIVVDDYEAFEKHGYGKAEPYQFIFLDQIKIDYGETSEQSFYRCSSNLSLEQKSSPIFSQVILALNLVEEKVEQLIFSHEENKLEKIKQDSEYIESEIIGIILKMKSLNYQNLSSADQMEFIFIASKIVSLSQQLSEMGRNQLSLYFSHWLYDIDSAETIFSQFKIP